MAFKRHNIQYGEVAFKTSQAEILLLKNLPFKYMKTYKIIKQQKDFT